MNAITDDIAHALADPATSVWLNQALRAALQRDPVDAANDAAHLADLLAGRCEAVLFLAYWQDDGATL